MAASLLLPMGTLDTVLTLSAPSTFPSVGGLVLVESEQIRYTMSSDTQLIGLTRGVNGTSAATHAKGVTVTLLESAATSPVARVSLNLDPQEQGTTMDEADPQVTNTDPSAITNAMIDSNTVLYLFGHAGNITKSLPKPTNLLASRKLIVVFDTDAARSCTINSVSITAATAQMFVYMAGPAAWYPVA